LRLPLIMTPKSPYMLPELCRMCCEEVRGLTLTNDAVMTSASAEPAARIHAIMLGGLQGAERTWYTIAAMKFAPRDLAYEYPRPRAPHICWGS
jgi:hypothetical protein